MIELKQFAGSVIQPEDDARLYDFIISQNTGIIEGCQITHLGANKLQISAGWGICCGRVFVVTAETIDAQLSTGDNMQGRILIEINTGITLPAKFVTQAAASLPEITKEDLNKGGTVHQIPLATYKVNALTVSEMKDVRKIITSPQSAAEKAQQTADNAKANAFSLYTHTAGSLTGGGANGKFKATVSETVTKLNVNGVSCTIKSGGETQMELIAGCWYTFILDGTTVNFSGGGAGISKSKLVDALQYSDLGITENMTNQEIITQLKSKYPPYVDIVDASKGIYNLDNWLEFLYGEHVTEQPNGLQLYQYASGGSGLVQYKTKIVIKKNSVLTFTINKYHEIKDVAVGISNELEIGYNYSYLYDKFVKKVEVTGVGHYSMSFEDIPEGSYYISIRIKSNQFKPFLIIDELKVTHKI